MHISNTTSAEFTSAGFIDYRTDFTKHYLQQKLSPQDKSFMTIVGSDLSRVQTAEGNFNCFVQGLYVDQFKAPQAPAYFSLMSVKTGDEDMIAMHRKIQGEPLSQADQDRLKSVLSSLLGESHTQAEHSKEQIAKALASLQDRIHIQVTNSREQMIKLLEEAKLIFAQRGVDGEAQVVEAVKLIDDVLANIARVQELGERNGPDYFVNLYSEAVKHQCELAVGLARNPLNLVSRFLAETAGAGGLGSIQECFEQVSETTVRLEARKMAETLKERLAPWAAPLRTSEQLVLTNQRQNVLDGADALFETMSDGGRDNWDTRGGRIDGVARTSLDTWEKVNNASFSRKDFA